MILNMTRDLPDVVDAKRQMARDQKTLWAFVIGLRNTEAAIQNSRNCWQESKDLLKRLDGLKQ